MSFLQYKHSLTRSRKQQFTECILEDNVIESDSLNQSFKKYDAQSWKKKTKKNAPLSTKSDPNDRKKI